MRITSFLKGLSLIALAILMMLLRYGNHPFICQTVVLALVLINAGIMVRICTHHR